MWADYSPSAIATTVIIGVGALFYSVTQSLSILGASPPLKSPVSRLGFLLFRHFWPSVVHWFVKWTLLLNPICFPRRIVDPVAKVLLWRPHTDSGLVQPSDVALLSFPLYLPLSTGHGDNCA